MIEPLGRGTRRTRRRTLAKALEDCADPALRQAGLALVTPGPGGNIGDAPAQTAAILALERALHILAELDAAKLEAERAQAQQGPQPAKRPRCLFSKKVIFASERAAKERRRAVGSDSLRVYKCPKCLGWHMTKSTAVKEMKR